MMKNKKLYGSFCLIFATVIWGSAFIAQSVGMDHIGPMTFQAARCFLAVLFLLPVVFLLEPDKKLYLKKWKDPLLWKSGLICGSALFLAAGLQQIGLVYTAAGKAGFITAMYIVIVPILGLVFRRRPPVTAWISVALAVVGLYLLSYTGSSKINIGDIYLLCSALGFAVQITLIDRMASQVDSLRLNCIQSLVCALFSAVVMIFTEQPNWGDICACWLPLGYAGILSMGVAYSLQIIGQQHVAPTPASLMMSLESVFAALFGWLILNEYMRPVELCGCALVFCSVILSQLPVKKLPKNS